MHKTPAQIIARINTIKGDDWMGTQQGDLISYLPFADAKPFLKEAVTEDQWSASAIAPLDVARDYLAFAWDKANNCRGLSAGRSLDHLKAWLWLAGFENVVAACFEDYERYGKKQLAIASEICGFDWSEHDNGAWVNDEDGPSLDADEILVIAREAKAIAEAAKEAA